MGNVGKYAFLAGVVLAIVMSLVDIPSGAVILGVLGLIVGLLNVSGAESEGFLVAAIALMMSATSISIIPQVGGWLAAVSGNLAAFVAPAALVVAVKSLVETSKD